MKRLLCLSILSLYVLFLLITNFHTVATNKSFLKNLSKNKDLSNCNSKYK